MKQQNDPVLIIGGGYAGLVAANELKKNNVPFRLLEGGTNIGGLAQTFTDSNGFKFDFGTHLITNRLAKTLEIEDECINVGYFGESIWLQGKAYKYPFGLFRRIKYPIGAIIARFKGISTKKHHTLKDKLQHELGGKLANEVAIPLAESLMGAPASYLSTATNDKLPGLFQTLYLRLAGLIMGKAVAIGYSMELPEKASVWHVYPKDGIKTVCHKLAKNIEKNIQLESRVDRIFVENEQVTGLRVNGEVIPTSFVINTAPVNILTKMVEGTQRLEKYSHFKYRSVVFVNIMLEGEKLLPNVAMWFPEDKYPFFRLNEPSHSMPWLTPEGKSIITADIGCEVNDEYWNRTEEEWSAAILPYLDEIVPDIGDRFIGCKVLKTKIAYPSYLKEYEDERNQFIKNTGITGLYSIGRNGEFSHILMEDVYVRTKRKMKDVIEKYTENISKDVESEALSSVDS